MKRTSEQLAMLGRLGMAPEGHQFRELLRMELDEAHEVLRGASGDTLMRTQGRAALLAELLRLTDPTQTRTRPAEALPRAIRWEANT